MKKLFLLLLFFTFIAVSAQNNDCANAMLLCDNADLNLNPSGFGIQELSTATTCNGQENNSVWLKFTINNAGTLGFIITPNNTSLTENYDFFVFGPNKACGNLGQSIKCSTTDPVLALLTNNTTGLNNTSIDDSEGPDNDGDGFLKELDVLAGETYYIVIDQKSGTNGFNLQWSGSATFTTAPRNMLPAGETLNIAFCDGDGVGSLTLDLTTKETEVVGAQNVTTSYHATYADALNGTEIITPAAYVTATSTAYIKLIDNTTGCFSIFSIPINISVGNLSFIQPPNLTLYDADEDGFETFDLSTQETLVLGDKIDRAVSFYTSFAMADTGLVADQIAINYTNIANPETIWIRFEDTVYGCYGIRSFTISTYFTPLAHVQPDWHYCDGDNDGFYTFDFSTLTPNIIGNQNSTNINVSYHKDQADADVNDAPLPLQYTNQVEYLAEDIYVRVENTLNPTLFNTFMFTISVSDTPVFDVIDTDYICINLLPQNVDVIIENPHAVYSYSWKDSLGNELSTSKDFVAHINDDYTVTATSTDGFNCTLTKTIHILPAEPATVTDVIINEYWVRENFSLDIEVSGTGIYQYSLDNPLGPFQDEPHFFNVKPGIHEIFITELNNCGMISKKIDLFGFTPFFTPNGDGINDIWKVQGIRFHATHKISIFDRYGKLVHQFLPALGQGWNGQYRGIDTPEADYWFTAEMFDYKGEHMIRKGHFSLKRN